MIARTLLALLILTTPGLAKTIVLGPTVPIDPILQQQFGVEAARTKPPRDPFSLAHSVPILSDLTVGAVAARPLPDRGITAGFGVGARPVFLIGADRVSLGWLARNRDALERIRAVGLIVQADTVEDMVLIEQAAAGVPVYPASGASIAAELGIRHYPVVIDRAGIRATP